MDDLIPNSVWEGYDSTKPTPSDAELTDDDLYLVDDEDVVTATPAAPEPAPRPAATPARRPGPRGTAPAAAAASTASAPEPTTASAEDPVADKIDVQAVERTRKEAFYARRRRRYAAIAAVVAVGVVWFLGRNVFTSIGHPTQSAAAAAVHTDVDAAHPAAPADVTADLTKAEQVLASDGNLTGIYLPGARVASNGTTMYASRTVSGTCWAYAIIAGKPTDAQVDPAGTSCTDAAIAATQQRIDAVAGDKANVSRAEATAALQNAASLVGWYGTHNMVDGAPNLTGLVMPDKTVAASNNTGDHVRLTTTVGGTCLTAVVAADGSAALPQICS